MKNHTATPVASATDPQYRADIDGLRAIAVLAVVIYHAFPRQLQGGFVGVDIFFVISGYLITRIILKAQAENGFSLLDFYSRRIRRIFPALATVLICCLLFGWIFLLAGEYERLGAHAAAGAAYVSNVILMKEGGYFDVSAQQKPLLHLWSLAIEEQFYMVWPLLLILTHRLGAKALITIVVGAFVSFSLNIYFIGTHPVETFYLPFTRAWELLAGAILAWLSLRGMEPGRWSWSVGNFHKYPPGTAKLANTISWIGLLLILVAVVGMKSSASFPGWLALIPVSGASLIILAGNDAWLNRIILSSRPAVFLGLISYPLYLWHWPLLSFGWIAEGREPTFAVRTILVAVAVLLAWATYLFIEKPMRHAKLKRGDLRFPKFDMRGPAPGLFLLLLFIGGAGYAIHRHGGFPERSQETNRLASELGWDEYFQLVSRETSECLPISFRENAHKYKNEVLRCRQTVADESRHDIALVGDSHAEHLFWGLARHASRNTNVVYYTHSCFPFIGMIRLGMQECQRMEEALSYIAGSESIKVVVLSAFWQDRYVQTDFRLNFDQSIVDRDEVFRRGLRGTLDLLTSAGKDVIIVLDGPTLDFDPARCLRQMAFLPGKCSFRPDQSIENQKRYRSLIGEVLRSYPDVKLHDPMRQLCPGESCSVMMNGHFIYKDRSHLSTHASEHLGVALHQLIRDLH